MVAVTYVTYLEHKNVECKLYPRFGRNNLCNIYVYIAGLH